MFMSGQSHVDQLSTETPRRDPHVNLRSHSGMGASALSAKLLRYIS